MCSFDVQVEMVLKTQYHIEHTVTQLKMQLNSGAQMIAGYQEP